MWELVTLCWLGEALPCLQAEPGAYPDTPLLLSYFSELSLTCTPSCIPPTPSLKGFRGILPPLP